MKKGTLILITCLSLIIFKSEVVSASHSMGASITYKWIRTNTYEFTISFYRDCAGIAAPDSVPLNFVSTGCTSNRTYQLSQRSSRGITPICPYYVDSTYCSGGFIPGAQEYIYMDTISLPVTCQWHVSYLLCCRNAAITNLVNPANYNIYVETFIGDTTVDNSPVFQNIPAIYVATGQTYNLNFGAYDLDGDSLSYQLSNPLNNAATPLAYNTGFSDTVPMTSSTPITLDPVTGILSVTPQGTPQTAVITVLVNEYRRGRLIGTISRDIEVISNNSSNQLPTTTGINGSGQFAINVCAGDTLRFSLPTADADTGQIVTFNAVSNIPGATFTTDTTSRPTGNFTWVPDSTMVSGTPYILHFELNDNACPDYGRQAYAVKIYVDNCNNGSVWPGDANNDFVANVYDILPIGLAYGDTGVTRLNATTNWVGQLCADWTDTIPSGVNAKNADCNGDGVVDSNDVGAIYLNYSLTHNKTSQQNRSVPLKLYGNLSSNSIHPGDTLMMSVMLGDTATSATNAYGLAFSLNYDNRFVTLDSNSADFSSNWLKPAGGRLLSIAKFFPGLQSVDLGAVRTNHSDTTGHGEILQLRFFVKDSASIAGIDSQQVQFSFSGAKMVDASGLDVPVSAATDSILWKKVVATGINGLADNQDFQLYPNPTTGQLNIVLSGKTIISHLDILNLIGETIASDKTINGNRATVAIPSASIGIYMVAIITTDGQVRHKKFVLAKE